jgi:superfamily II DNA or RNA helicase
MTVSEKDNEHELAEETRSRAGDPFLLDADGLNVLASEKIVQRGVNYFKEHRVTDISWGEEGIRANVEGSVPDEPYVVEIGLDAGGELVVDCTCPFDWEPVCKHAVATLLAYAARQPVTAKQVANATEEAVEARAKRGRSEVKVKHVSGAPGFGTWTARSVTPTGGISREYRVEIRSVDEKLNRCACADFATNQLGTCKHIEAVLHRLRKRNATVRKTAARTGVPVVHVAWNVPSAPRVQVRRPDRETPELAQLLDRHFDAEGFLRGELPGALARFEREATEHEVDIGDDAREHAARVGERAAQRERAARVREEIARSGGQIPGLRARLYPYQVEGVAFLAATGRALLADDMGLGKTLQTIAATSWMREHEGVERVLVVCPASLKHQWAREVRKFTDLDVEVIRGGLRSRRTQYRMRRTFTVVNYEVVMRDHERILSDLAPDLVVVDEAQRIKNWRTKTATAVKTLASRYAFVLSGTPLENRLEDLYSVMQMVDPRVLGPLWRFMLDFHVTDERGKALGYRNLSDLRQRLAPVMLRRNRRLVEDQLPPRVEQRLDVAMTQTQRELHDGAMMTAVTIAKIAAQRPLTPSEEHRLLAALQNARMACNAAGLVDDKTEGSPKLSELERLLEELCVEGGEKVVIFSQWERMTRMAEAVAEGLGIGVVRLHGGVPTEKRGALISRFENDPDVQVFLSTDAGGVGLNLQAASVLINLDLPWNPAVLDQRIGRVHRLGQRKTVRALLLVSSESYEERIMGLLGSKRMLFSNVIEAGEEDVVGLSKRVVEAAMATLVEEDGQPMSEEDLAAAGTGGMEDVLPEPLPPPAVEDLARGDDTKPAPGATPRGSKDADVSHVVEQLQAELGSRLERVLVSRQGLLAVVDATDADTHHLAEQLSGLVPVAIVDRLTYAALRRIGAGTPASGDGVLWQRPEDSAEAAAPHPLDVFAHRKLEAAEALVQHELGAEAAGLLAQAVLASLARRADRDQVPPPAEAAVWLFGEAVPQGRVTADDASIALRADALSRAPLVPPAMVQEVLAQARRIVLGELPLM